MKYLVIKRYKLPSLKKTQKNLKCILLSERSQLEQATYSYDSNYDSRNLEKAKLWRQLKKTVVAKGWREKGMNGWNKEF